MVLTRAFMPLSYDLPGQHWYCSYIVFAAKATQIPSLCPCAEMWWQEVEARGHRMPTHRPLGAGGRLETPGRIPTLNWSPPTLPPRQ